MAEDRNGREPVVIATDGSEPAEHAVVAGARIGLGAVAGALLGSVSGAIIHRADRPVLVVSSADAT